MSRVHFSGLTSVKGQTILNRLGSLFANHFEPQLTWPPKCVQGLSMMLSSALNYFYVFPTTQNSNLKLCWLRSFKKQTLIWYYKCLEEIYRRKYLWRRKGRKPQSSDRDTSLIVLKWGRRKGEQIGGVSGHREALRKSQLGKWGILKAKVSLDPVSAWVTPINTTVMFSLWLGAAQGKHDMNKGWIRRAASGTVSQSCLPEQVIWVGLLLNCHLGGSI